MTLKMTDQFKQDTLVQLFSTWLSMTMHLYKNDPAVSHTSVIGDFTEADFTGYSAHALPAPSYSLNGSFQAVATFAPEIFTQSGTAVTCDVYGYYVTDSFGNLLWAERNASAPVSMNFTGAVYQVDGQFTFTNNPAP